MGHRITFDSNYSWFKMIKALFHLCLEISVVFFFTLFLLFQYNTPIFGRKSDLLLVYKGIFFSGYIIKNTFKEIEVVEHFLRLI